ncbi:hypothetical protein BGZ52_009443, partial [Haplosporangium bisporale]
LRPFGVSFIYGGWDEHFGLQLYHSDPSGNYSGWKATCIGANTASAQGILRQEYKEEGVTLQEAKNMAIKVLSKTMDTTSLGSDKIEFATLELVDGRVVRRIFNQAEIEALLKENNLLNKTEEAK